MENSQLKLSLLRGCGGPSCHSKRHISEMLSAVTKGSLRQIQSFLKTCPHSVQTSDPFDRTVLHMAASMGKTELIQWLIQTGNVDLEKKDKESGWTALHRAFFYGQIHVAVQLIQLGSGTQQLDKDGLTPLDLVRLDQCRWQQWWTKENVLCNVYTWGINSNFNLGHEVEHSRRVPSCVEHFTRSAIYVSQVVMSKYHTLFLCTNGSIWACGHGRGGRLGVGSEETCLRPCQVSRSKAGKYCAIAASADHSIFLTKSGMVLSCGLNSHHQLGQSNIRLGDTCLSPQVVNMENARHCKEVIGVTASCFHSVFWTKHHLYTFGLNAGQLGHQRMEKEPYVRHARLVTALDWHDFAIQQVCCSSGATAVLSSSGDIYVLEKYQCRKVATRWSGIALICVAGGLLDRSLSVSAICDRACGALVFLVLQTSGVLFLRQGATFRRCCWSLGRPLHVVDVFVNEKNFCIVTAHGEAFKADFPKPSSGCPSSPSKETAATLSLSGFSLKGIPPAHHHHGIVYVSVSRVPGVHQAHRMVTDPLDSSCAILQVVCASSCALHVPQCAKSINRDVVMLFDEADAYVDVHDVVLCVGTERLPCHRYILASKSSYFSRIFSLKHQRGQGTRHAGGDEVMQVMAQSPDDSAALVRQMVQFIYSGTNQLLGAPGDASAILMQWRLECASGGANMKTYGDARLEMAAMAHRYGVAELEQSLKSCDPTICEISFSFDSFKHLADVTLHSSDEAAFPCHKCILVARLEYFKAMFSSHWLESSKMADVSLPISSKILHVLLHFLYTDELQASGGVEFFCQLLSVADQWLMQRLKRNCEAKIIPLINLRNCIDVFEFSCIFTADSLKNAALVFLYDNLLNLLENRGLEKLSGAALLQLTDFYRKQLPGASFRVITPYQSAPCLQVLAETEAAMRLVERGKLDKSGKHNFRHRRTSRNSVSECGLSDEPLKSPSSVEEKEDEADENLILKILVSQAKKSERSVEGCAVEKVNDDSGAAFPEKEMLVDGKQLPDCAGLGLGTSDCAGLGLGTSDCAGSGTPDCAGFGTPDCAGSGTPDCAGSGTPNCAGSGTSDCAGSGTPDCAGSGTSDCAGSGTPDCAVSWSGASDGKAGTSNESGPCLREIMQQQNAALSKGNLTSAPKSFPSKRTGNFWAREKRRSRAVSTPPEAGPTDGLPRAPGGASREGGAWGSPPSGVMASLREVMRDEESIVRNANKTQPGPAGTPGPARPSSGEFVWGSGSAQPGTPGPARPSSGEFVWGSGSAQPGTPGPARPSSSEFVWGSSSAQPGSPGPVRPSSSEFVWGSGSAQPCPVGDGTGISFRQIVVQTAATELARRDERTKPLHLIQIEERAIAELRAFYRVDENFDSYTTVERIDTLQVEPSWVSASKVHHDGPVSG